MMLAATHLAHTRAHEALASWENEGGASTPTPASRQRPEAAQWPASVIDQGAEPMPPGADKGITDTHSLAVLQISLLLLVPTLAGIAIFWGDAAVRGAQ